MLHQCSSQCTLLCVAVDNEQCRWIFIGALRPAFGPSGFTWSSPDFIIAAVWVTAAPPVWLTHLLRMRYFGHRCTAVLFSVRFASFRFDLAGLSFFWFTLFAVRWLCMLLWMCLGGRNRWLRLDSRRVYPGGCCSRVVLWRLVVYDHLFQVFIRLLLGKVDKDLQKRNINSHCMSFLKL